MKILGKVDNSDYIAIVSERELAQVQGITLRALQARAALQAGDVISVSSAWDRLKQWDTTLQATQSLVDGLEDATAQLQALVTAATPTP